MQKAESDRDVMQNTWFRHECRREQFDLDELHELRSAAEAELLAIEQGISWERDDDGFLVGVDSGETGSWVLPETSLSNRAYDLACSPQARTAFEAFIGAPVAIWPHVVVRAHLGSRAATAMHQDYPELQGGRRAEYGLDPLSPGRTRKGCITYVWCTFRNQAPPIGSERIGRLGLGGRSKCSEICAALFT